MGRETAGTLTYSFPTAARKWVMCPRGRVCEITISSIITMILIDCAGSCTLQVPGAAVVQLCISWAEFGRKSGSRRAWDHCPRGILAYQASGTGSGTHPTEQGHGHRFGTLAHPPALTEIMAAAGQISPGKRGDATAPRISTFSSHSGEAAVRRECRASDACCTLSHS